MKITIGITIFVVIALILGAVFWSRREGYKVNPQVYNYAMSVATSGQPNRQLLFPYLIASNPQLLYPPIPQNNIANTCFCNM